MNVEIKFELKYHVSFSFRPVFDSLLAFHYAKNVLGDDFATGVTMQQNQILDFSPLPLDRVEYQGLPLFLCSEMLFDQQQSSWFVERYRKAWSQGYEDLADFGKRKAQITISKGEFKSNDKPLSVLAVNAVWFYASVPDDRLQEFTELCRQITHIGKKSSQGYGLVSKLIISETEYDVRRQLCRPVPADFPATPELWPDLKAGASAFVSWRPPYWLPENQQLCKIPKHPKAK